MTYITGYSHSIAMSSTFTHEQVPNSLLKKSTQRAIQAQPYPGSLMMSG